MVSADDRKPIFSSKMFRFLQNRLMEIFGLLLLFLGVVLLTSLLTAGKTDPSFTQISDLPVQTGLARLELRFQLLFLLRLASRPFRWELYHCFGALVTCGKGQSHIFATEL